MKISQTASRSCSDASRMVTIVFDLRVDLDESWIADRTRCAEQPRLPMAVADAKPITLDAPYLECPPEGRRPIT